MKKGATNLSKKFAAYSSMAASLLAISNVASAQVIYTDIVPDYAGAENGATYDLDLNNDGTVDFKINYTSNGPSFKLMINANSSNAIAGTYLNPPYKYPSVLEANAEIGADFPFTWVTGNYQTLATSGYFGAPYGYWFGAVDGYMGLQLKSGSSEYYGWLRMDVAENGRSFIVKDYAFESTAGDSILAGNTGNVGIPTLFAAGYKIFAADQQVHIHMTEHAAGDITILNLLGKAVRSATINAQEMTIDLAGEPSGIYLVTIRQNGEVFTKKVMI